MVPAIVSDKQRCKLVLRVHSAEELQYSSSQGAYCKIYVGSMAMIEGSHKVVSKKDSTNIVASTDELNKAGQLEVRRTRTQHQEMKALALSKTVWDELLEVPIRPGVELARQVLTIRVKSQHLFFCPVIGACAVSLANLSPGVIQKQWFPLQRGKKPAGRIRVTLLIAPDDKVVVARRKQPNQDVVAARAANHEAEEAIKRLVDKQCRQEVERRPRQVECTSSGFSVEVKRLSNDADDNVLASINVDGLVVSDKQRREKGMCLPPSGVLPPKMLPPLGTPAALRHNCKQDEGSLTPQPSNDLHLALSPMLDKEQRLDSKLRQVRKETARLRKLKFQLKKYIPDLQIDSDSDDSLDSEEEP